ncbi:sigma factor-like helix-turn-helix DNA-binding protein [Brevundimonas diminuta]|nr:sigma factor-like helix-turn-helix DNA-binding protein [Brevundimonas diminuta]
MEERSHAEAAEILGLSVKAVEMRVARARQKLAQQLRVQA